MNLARAGLFLFWLRGLTRTILLHAGGAQSGQSVTVNRPLPAEILFGGQLIAPARLFEAEQAAADRGHNLRLATNDPASINFNVTPTIPGIFTNRATVAGGNDPTMAESNSVSTRCGERFIGSGELSGSDFTSCFR